MNVGMHTIPQLVWICLPLRQLELKRVR
jgi:hypothetical protein